MSAEAARSRGAPEAEQLVLDLGLLAVANCGNMMQYVAGACLRWYPSLAMFYDILCSCTGFDNMEQINRFHESNTEAHVFLGSHIPHGR